MEMLQESYQAWEDGQINTYDFFEFCEYTHISTDDVARVCGEKAEKEYSEWIYLTLN